MADVRPFRGLRYNTDVAGDLSHIISPPFDTIPLELQSSLYRQSPYNVVRLEAGEKLASDHPHHNRYTRAAALLADWIRSRVLVREKEPAFYLVRHSFNLLGQDRARLELMACVRLEEYQRRVVLPHEFTRDEDKRDRLALIGACHANFSPIMCLYRDQEKKLAPIFGRIMAEPSLVAFSDAGEQGYTVWRIDHPQVADEIRDAMASRPLYIADGHHRYETALTFRDRAASGQGGALPKDDGVNFVMMGLIEFDDPGLVVLPYHRVAGGLGDTALARVRDGLAAFFDSETYEAGPKGGIQRLLEEIELRGRDKIVMGLLDSGGDGLQLLTLRKEVNPDAWGSIGASEAWILEEQVLRPILGESLARCVNYIHDGAEAEERVKSGEYQLGFFLKPFPLGTFEAIMNEGRRLPPKSTFFYPKLPTGIVINLLEGQV